ncbi:hypothetical protein NXY46_29565, partial [Bacteroides ovatus]|nr:hypothetical protein [Bacteroides ovatus]
MSAACAGKGGLRNSPIIRDHTGRRQWEFGYDRSGNLVSRTQPRRCRHEDDLPRRCGGIGGRPYGVVTKLAYDRFRNLTEASDSRGTTSLYGYDLLGGCVKVTNLKGAVQKREHDPVNPCGARARLRQPAT